MSLTPFYFLHWQDHDVTWSDLLIMEKGDLEKVCRLSIARENIFCAKQSLGKLVDRTVLNGEKFL